MFKLLWSLINGLYEIAIELATLIWHFGGGQRKRRDEFKKRIEDYKKKK